MAQRTDSVDREADARDDRGDDDRLGADAATGADTPGPQTPPGQPGTVFRATANNITTNVLARDAKGQFVPDLRADEFQVYEDGVLQKVSVFLPVIGGRPMGSVATAAPPPASSGGLILPRTIPPPDASGRIFIIFIDDLHLQASMTPKTKELLKQIRDTLVKDSDLVGFVSSGYSSIASDIQYDYQHKRFDEAIKKTMGGGQTHGRDHQGAGRAGGPGGHAVPRARRVRHGARHSQTGREDHEPPQVVPLRQQRLRLQSVQGLAPEVSAGSVRDSRQERPATAARSRARTRTTTTIRSRSRASSLPKRIWSPSSPS